MEDLGTFDEQGRFNCSKCGRKWHLGQAYSSLYYAKKHYANNHHELSPISFRAIQLKIGATS